MATSYKVSVTIIEKIAASNWREIHIQCCPTDTIGQLRSKIHEKLEKSKIGWRIEMAYKGQHLKDDSVRLQSCNLIPAELRPIPKMFVTFKKLSPVAIKSKSTRQTENVISSQDNATNVVDDSKTNDDVNDPSTPPTNDPTNPSSSPSHVPTYPINPPAMNEHNDRSDSDHSDPIPAMPGIDDIVDIQYQNLTGNEDEQKLCRICFSSEENNPLLGKLFSPCRYTGF